MSYAFFYKSVNGDRVYDDTSFEHWLKKFFTSGVFLNDLQVTANDDMTVTVGTGYVNANGKVKIFENATPLIIETAGATYPRIDSIVLERNDTERDILLKVVKGGYSSQPVPHTPIRQNGVYQLVIAQVLVNAGAVKVTQANITDTRSNIELCGIVAGAVDQIDFSQIQAQFDAYFAQYKSQIVEDYTVYNEDMERYLNQMEEDFTEWFNKLKDILSEDVAGQLYNLITKVEENVGDLSELETSDKSSIVNAINEVNENVTTKEVEGLTTMEQVEACTEPERPVGAGAIQQLNESLGGLLKVVIGSNTEEVAISSGASKTVNFAVDEPSGYTRLGIIGLTTSNGRIVMSSFGSNTAGGSSTNMTAYNPTTDAITLAKGKVFARFLYVKNIS